MLLAENIAKFIIWAPRDSYIKRILPDYDF